MNIVFFAAALIVLVIDIAFAVYAGGIAEKKGYSKGNWIAVCLFFGVIGYILVAALPDLELRTLMEKTNAEIKSKPWEANKNQESIEQAVQPKKVPVWKPSTKTAWNARNGDEWKCPKCGTMNQRNALFCKDCGEYK